MDATTETLRKTPLHALHVELGAKMVPFAGYDMPVQYSTGVLKEHLHTRAAAGLFDVSHMGQGLITGPSHEATAKTLEALTPGDFLSLGVGRQRYTMLLTKDGGIIDDLMVSRVPGRHEAEFAFGIVFNASRKEIDSVHVTAHLPPGVQLHMADNRALLALQGPKSEAVMARHCPDVVKLTFMGVAKAEFDGIEVGITRSGYTGEDGFEISVREPEAEKLARTLLAEPEVLPIGLGARDSLRLEAGLCLYGHDIDETTSPVEADLTWAIGKRRKEEKNFPGAARIMNELANGTKRKRVGLRPHDKAPAREGTEITVQGRVIGRITSGGFGPSVNAPIAMGYVETNFSDIGAEMMLMVRGVARPARIAPMPFVAHRYKRTMGKT
jgi:glycine cleavage system T protein (aminomethyltransferase)